MLDFWIIEELLRRERCEEAHQRPFLELPIGREPEESPEREGREEEQKRGVVVIDFGG